MNSSMRSVLACERSPCKPSRFGFLARKLSNRFLFDSQKTASQVSLEDKLLVKENRCLELRHKIEAKQQEVTERRGMAGRRALSSSHLASKQRAPAPDSSSDTDGDSLKRMEALEAKLLRKKEECASLRQQAQSEASKRGRLGRSMAGRRVASMSSLGSQPLKPALRKEEPSFRSAKSVSWGQL
jgi:hypothetical protein